MAKKILHIKTELSGVFSLMKLLPEHIKILKEHFDDTEYFTEQVILDLVFNSEELETIKGVYTTLSAEEDGLIKNGDYSHIYKNNSIEDGFGKGVYLFFAKENKSGFYIDLDTTEEDFDINKLEILYNQMDYFFLEGHNDYVHSIITGVKYDGKDYTQDMNDNLYGGPYDIEFTIFQTIEAKKVLKYIVRFSDYGVRWYSEIE